MTEIERLRRLLKDDRIHENEASAFENMLDGLESRRWPRLTEKQAAWLKSLEDRLELNVGDAPEVLFDSGKIPRGKDVQAPDVLRHLPKAPPGRRTTS